jgi:DNA polymerase elongation subunit (family B)
MLGGILAKYLENEEDSDDLSYALKIVINIVYGMTSAKFDNKFKDPRNIDNIVAKRGALFMIDLKNYLQDMGIPVVHIKTDSIKIPMSKLDADIESIVKKVTDFGKRYGYDFEYETKYEKFCLVNDAVYIAKIGWSHNGRGIGTWEAVGAQFAQPYVYKTLFM